MNSNTLKLLAIVIASSLLLGGCGGGDDKPAAKTTSHENEEAGGHAEKEGHVELNQERATAAGIEIETAGPAAIREVLPLYGGVHLNAERLRDVTARYPGVISQVNKTVGEAVKQGETLATVESDESLRSYRVTSPLSGVITMRKANQGEKAGDAPLFTVADLSTVWVELSLFPRDLAKVRVGQAVRVRSVDAGLSADGKISYISPLGQSTSQTLSARITLDNGTRQWAPGLYVVGDVSLSEKQVAVAVKSIALQTLEGRAVVFVQEGDGFEAMPVSLGRVDGEFTEIVSGLDAGSRYAAKNSFVLKSEAGKGEAEHGH